MGLLIFTFSFPPGMQSRLIEVVCFKVRALVSEVATKISGIFE